MKSRAPLFVLGKNKMSAQEAQRVLAAIVPAHILGPFRHEATGMFKWLLAYLPVRVEHEANRLRGYAFTSNEDEGFSHAREEG